MKTKSVILLFTLSIALSAAACDCPPQGHRTFCSVNNAIAAVIRWPFDVVSDLFSKLGPTPEHRHICDRHPTYYVHSACSCHPGYTIIVD